MSQRCKAILYTRTGCHLCEDVKAVLEQHGLEVQEVDIDHDPTLVAQYGLRIPVVAIGGVERFEGRVNEVLLRRLLNAQADRDDETSRNR